MSRYSSIASTDTFDKKEEKEKSTTSNYLNEATNFLYCSGEGRTKSGEINEGENFGFPSCVSPRNFSRYRKVFLIKDSW